MNAIARRTMAAALSIILVVQNAGCGSAPTQTEVQTECGDESRPLLSEGYGTISTQQAIFEYQKNGQLRCALGAPPRRYTVVVVIEWSNGWVDGYEVTTDLSAEPGQRYLVLAFEKGKGQVPIQEVKVLGYVSTPAKALILIGAVPVMVVMGVLYLPYWLMAVAFEPKKQPQPSAQTKKPTGKPSKDCCFIWIKHGSSGEVMAGTAPQLDEPSSTRDPQKTDPIKY